MATGLSPLTFMALLTSAEQSAIATAALQTPAIMLWMIKLAAAQYIDPSDPQTQGGIHYMVQGGLLTQARADEVLAAITVAKPVPLTVATSTFDQGQPFDGGRFWVNETFILSDGSVRTSMVLCDPGTDCDALLAGHAAQMNAQLVAEASQ